MQNNIESGTPSVDGEGEWRRRGGEGDRMLRSVHSQQQKQKVQRARHLRRGGEGERRRRGGEGDRRERFLGGLSDCGRGDTRFLGGLRRARGLRLRLRLRPRDRLHTTAMHFVSPPMESGLRGPANRHQPDHEGVL